MKKLFVLIASLNILAVEAQFNIHLSGPKTFDAPEGYIYTLSGSKDMLVTKIKPDNGTWNYHFDAPYTGMLKVYFPKYNNSLIFISENKDVDIAFDFANRKIGSIKYLDEANRQMNEVQDILQKQEQILPALYELQEYYKPESTFGTALEKEAQRLSTTDFKVDPQTHPFIAYYAENYPKYMQAAAGKAKISQQATIDFLSKSDYRLETSGLMRQILVNYVNSFSKNNSSKAIDDLLTAVNVESPRGQVILAELIDIFDAYGLDSMKEKYLALAGGLKCTITDQLASTLKANKNVEIGAKFPDYKFNNPLNTTAKSIYTVKANYKVVLFWAATCTHCEAQIPQLMQNYTQLKAKGVEIVGLSMDSNADEYSKKAALLPWINDAELKGWYSSYADAYNVHGTPTYFILDAQNKILAKPQNAGQVLEFFKLK